MQYDLQEFKRSIICPVLNKNNWDYNPFNDLHPTYLYVMREIFKWFYRRNNRITLETISSALTNHSIKTKMDYNEKLLLEKAVRKFINGSLYQGMAQPYFGKEVRLYVNEHDTLSYTVPVTVMKNKKLLMINFDLGKIDKEDYLRRYETMFQSIWGFYVLEQIPTFINLYQKEDEIVEQEFKIDQDYVLFSRQTLSNVGKKIKSINALPPYEVCKHCARRAECLQETKKKQKR